MGDANLMSQSNTARDQKPEPIGAQLVLASGSPRRRELLSAAGYQFIVVPPDPDVECGVCSDSGPAGLVAELASRKAGDVRRQILSSPSLIYILSKPSLILAADTVAECDGVILGKPRDEDDARTMLKTLSGREHRVFTGVCLLPLVGGCLASQDLETAALARVAVTRLRMDRLTEAQLDEYIAGGEWEGKAGAFGYQDRLGWVHVVEGSETNVVGLPMEMLSEMLARLRSR